MPGLFYIYHIMKQILYLLTLVVLISCGDKPATSTNTRLQSLINEYGKFCSDSDNVKFNATQLDSCKAEMQHTVAQLSGGTVFNFNGVQYQIFIADLDSHYIDLHLYNSASTINQVKTELESQNKSCLMITNAGMFTPTYEPEGLYVQNSTTLFKLDSLQPDTNLNFYLQPNGVFFIDTANIPHIVTTRNYFKVAANSKPRIATQSGPMLVIDGKLHQAFKPNSENKYVRSGVGLLSNGKVVFACTVNGSNFYNFASVFKDVFGCANALFLDGAISLMYQPGISPQTTGGQFGPIISVTSK